MADFPHVNRIFRSGMDNAMHMINPCFEADLSAGRHCSYGPEPTQG